MGCRVCDSTNLELVLDLGQQPWGNNFLQKDMLGDEVFYPLRLFFCVNCSTVQLDFTIPKEVMFGDHTYLSGVTSSLKNHFKEVADETVKKFFPDTASQKVSVLDIGSNDGSQLKYYESLGCDILGVESSVTTAKIANDNNIPTMNNFFNLELADQLDRKFDIVNASGVFFHLEELHSVAKGIKKLLERDGVFVVQFLYLKSLVENMAFDQIYHEHLLYYNLSTLQVLLKRHGLELFDVRLAPIHGGSIIGHVSHQGRHKPSDRLVSMLNIEKQEKANEIETFHKFAENLKIVKEENLRLLGDFKSQGKKIYGFGAPVKGNTMLNYFGVGTQYLDCLVEKNPLRKGLFSPGMHIPVVMENEIDPPDVYYVLAWNFKKEILANNKALIEKGVIFHFPVNPKSDKG